MGSDHISKIWSPLRESLQAEKDAVLGWVWGFFTTTFYRWANAVVGVDAEMAIPLQNLPYVCAKTFYRTYNIRKRIWRHFPTYLSFCSLYTTNYRLNSKAQCVQVSSNSPNTACENTRRYRIEKRLRMGLDQISKIWSPLRRSQLG